MQLERGESVDDYIDIWRILCLGGRERQSAHHKEINSSTLKEAEAWKD
jgi:hypothetical protein